MEVRKTLVLCLVSVVLLFFNLCNKKMLIFLYVFLERQCKD